MATFVHLTPEQNLRAIRRSGLRPGPARPDLPAGVYALPTGPEFALSHQWLREMKWSGQRTIWAVYFRLPDEEPVWMGHYGGPHNEVTAGEAAALFFQAAQEKAAGIDHRLGYEAVVPRRVEPDEIHRIRRPPQDLGWRHSPDAHTRPLTCDCPFCVPTGSIRGALKRERLRAAGFRPE
jgi:hypothetical protein